MQTDKSSDGKISEDEFINLWIKFETSLKDKIRNKDQEIMAAEGALQENVIYLI